MVTFGGKKKENSPHITFLCFILEKPKEDSTCDHLIVAHYIYKLLDYNFNSICDFSKLSKLSWRSSIFSLFYQYGRAELTGFGEKLNTDQRRSCPADKCNFPIYCWHTWAKIVLLMPFINLHACPEWFHTTLKPILIQSRVPTLSATKTSALNSDHVFDWFLVIPLACLII